MNKYQNFKKSVTLKEMEDYLKAENYTEITRVLIDEKVVIVEYQ